MTITKSSLKRRDKMEGLKLAAKYSYVCEKARLLKFSNDLYDYFRHGKGEAERIEKILKNLLSYDFYRRIAQLNHKEPFDEEVVSFYWKGNPELKGEEWIHNASTLIPIIQIKMHQIVEELVDDCVVHPAKISDKISNREWWVIYQPITKTLKKDKLTLGPKVELIVQNELDLDLKEGDWVTVHFRKVIEKISQKEADKLLKLTKEALKNFNKKNKQKAR